MRIPSSCSSRSWKRALPVLVMLMMLAAGAGCSSLLAPEPDLERLYATHGAGVGDRLRPGDLFFEAFGRDD